MWYFIKIWIICNSGAELLTLPEHLSSPPVLSGVRVTRSLVLYVCLVDRCLSFCTFFFWPLCCLFYFDIRFLIAPLVSSNSSCIIGINRLWEKNYRKQCKNYNKYPILIRSQFVSTGLPDTDLLLCDTTCYIYVIAIMATQRACL